MSFGIDKLPISHQEAIIETEYRIDKTFFIYISRYRKRKLAAAAANENEPQFNITLKGMILLSDRTD